MDDPSEREGRGRSRDPVLQARGQEGVLRCHCRRSSPHAIRLRRCLRGNFITHCSRSWIFCIFTLGRVPPSRQQEHTPRILARGEFCIFARGRSAIVSCAKKECGRRRWRALFSQKATRSSPLWAKLIFPLADAARMIYLSGRAALLKAALSASNRESASGDLLKKPRSPRASRS